RSSLAHLVDHGLVPRLDLEAVRALAASSEVAAKTTDSPGHLVMRMDVDPGRQRIAEMRDDELYCHIEEPHRLTSSDMRHDVQLRSGPYVSSFGYLEGPVVLCTRRTYRRGREITVRTISVSI